MQEINPPTPDQLRAAGQESLLKLEIFVDDWVDICDLGGENYLMSISASHGGASMGPNPIAATLSAEINNEDAIFHPKNTDSAYSDYFRVGRKVRISVGAKYGGADCYWQRIIGYIDTPIFAGPTFELTISGFDYTKFLIDMAFKKTAVPPDNYWGAVKTFNSVASYIPGDQLYAPPGGDAGAKDEEANNVDKWEVKTNGSTAVSSENELGGFSDFEIEFIADPGNSASGVWYENCCAVLGGTEYTVAFKYARMSGDGNLRVSLRDGANVIGSSAPLDPAVNGDWYAGSFSFTPGENMTLDLHLTCFVIGASSTFRVDQISIATVGSITVHKYQMPEACNGVHYVEFDEESGFVPVWPGRQKDGEVGWFYDSDLQQFYFAEGKIVDDGTANLKVYYSTEQAPEDVVADLLVSAKVLNPVDDLPYADQAAALTAMGNPATGITIDQVWFEAGSSFLNAVRMLCERCDYRFHFKYDGTPVFAPFPSPKPQDFEDLVFDRHHIADSEYYEDKNEIRNRIVIEGLKQALPEGAEETVPSELKGTAYNQASIDEYDEHTLSIKNHLFQDQDSLDDMCSTLLARYKDPKWYINFDTPFNPAPLEIWDTIVTVLLLKPVEVSGKKYDTFKYDSGTKYGCGELTVAVRGIIRDIKIDKYNITYKCEEV